MTFHRDRTRFERPPSRWLVIPIVLSALALTTPFIVHWQALRSYGAPPARQLFDGLIIAGNLSDARGAGFTQCIDFKINLRCRRAGLMLMGHGPFSAAVDLAGGDGRGGFRQLTLWHDRNQDTPIDVAKDLERQGWASCRTRQHNWGDQAIFRREGSPLRISIDISYYGKRRIRIMSEWRQAAPHCM